jgi:hypothetical protein
MSPLYQWWYLLAVSLLVETAGYVPKHGISDHENVFVEPEKIVVTDMLQSCCELIRHHRHVEQDPLKLIQCVNQTAISTHKQVHAC